MYGYLKYCKLGFPVSETKKKRIKRECSKTISRNVKFMVHVLQDNYMEIKPKRDCSIPRVVLKYEILFVF